MKRTHASKADTTKTHKITDGRNRDILVVHKEVAVITQRKRRCPEQASFGLVGLFKMADDHTPIALKCGRLRGGGHVHQAESSRHCEPSGMPRRHVR